MDTLTHSIIGAVAARASIKADAKKSYVLVAALAAAFPDIDYILFWLNSYKFITEWHRGVTHSLMLLPVWAYLLSTVIFFLMKRRLPFNALFAYCSLGLLTHIASDLVTLYGVQLFAPLSNRRYALSISFDMDPWIGLMASISLACGFFNRSHAVYGLLAICAYLGLLYFLQQNALALVESRIRTARIQADRIYALPQPFLPFHWTLVIDRQDHYDIAYFSMFRPASKFISTMLVTPAMKTSPRQQSEVRSYNVIAAGIDDFHTEKNLEWRRLTKFGNSKKTESVMTVWLLDPFVQFRNFASLPALYRIDHGLNSECIWFTDLRYVFPLLTPPFRYGMCRSRKDRHWQLSRLRYQSVNNRQLIK